MSHENEHDPLGAGEQRQIERRLAALRPAPAQVDRDRLMFLAGMAQGSGFRVQGSEDSGKLREVPRDVVLPRSVGPRWAWPAATAALAATSLALLCALIARPTGLPQIVYRDRVIRVAAQPQQIDEPEVPRSEQANVVPITLAVHQRPVVAAVPADNYVRTREVALRMGLDAIGAPHSPNGDAPRSTSYGDWLQTLTGQSREE